MDVATAASSAMPIFFNPVVHVNGYNEQEMLVDGEIIANNPSMYSFVYACEKI